MGFGNFWLGFVVSDDRFRVLPAANEHLDNWMRFIGLTAQNQMSVVWCTNTELENSISERVEMVLKRIGCVKF